MKKFKNPQIRKSANPQICNAEKIIQTHKSANPQIRKFAITEKIIQTRKFANPQICNH